jgi:Uma2 family endonuclease
MSVATQITAEQLANMSHEGFRYELVAGELVQMSPSGWKHGKVAGRVYARLIAHVEAHDLGDLFAAETGFLLARDPDTVRAPDVALVLREHLPETPPDEAFWPGPPDLAVEVVSPGDRTGEVDEKVKAWLEAGSASVWVVNPMWRTVTIFHSAADIRTLGENDELDDEGVLPGFRCRVGEFFRGLQ